MTNLRRIITMLVAAGAIIAASAVPALAHNIGGG
jgi:hypothetical protein